MKNFFVGGLALLSMVSGCATLEHGTVGDKLGSKDAYVYLGSKDGVKPGDRVELFAKRCDEELWDGLPRHEVICTEDRIGHGTVTQLFDDDASLVRVDPGVDFASGVLVRPEIGAAH